MLQDDVAWRHLETASTFYLTTPSLVYFGVRAAEASKLSAYWGGTVRGMAALKHTLGRTPEHTLGLRQSGERQSGTSYLGLSSWGCFLPKIFLPGAFPA
jgi:hypothetical protein